MTTPKSATIPLRVGLVAGALVITGCWSIDGDLGVFTEGDTATGGDGTSTSESAGTSVGSDPGTGTAAPTSTDGGDENGESGEIVCPEGHPKLAPLWTAEFELDPEEGYLQDSFAVLSDGRIAVAAGSWSTFPEGSGVLWVGGDGSAQDWAFSPEDRPGYGPLGVRRAPDDSLVALGFTVEGEAHPMRLTRVPGDGSAVTVVDADLGQMAWPEDFELVGDSAVVIGRGYEEDEPFVMWVAQVDLDSGVLEWEVSPPSVNPVLGLEIATGPNGEIVAAHGTAGGAAEFKLWRLGDDGSVLWTADLLDPPAKTQELLDVVITPDEQVVALVQHYYPAKITLHAVGLAEGEVRWETQVAVEDESGSPGFGGALVDPDALLLPVARGPETFYSGDAADPITASLVRLSFTGEVLDDTPLPLTGLTAGYRTLKPARGKCGDLLLLHAQGGAELNRLWSFAP
ncbi:hypothetical protein [Nannocystis radixulma]|uniref:PQQ-like domain-containing protein n=1 Tax=Nannocystis radixulma TaxID=2995305 RepID=A0ABT5BBX8_9BACT|nr:hypothetical protein [Nannocystis radixulma]MDC0670567.1 hypothetical protein [Nannocystis radixulma]